MFLVLVPAISATMPPPCHPPTRLGFPAQSFAGHEPDLPASRTIHRRGVLRGVLSALTVGGGTTTASAVIDSVNPANNYYFPMAKYRYAPRILRAWIAVDELAPARLKDTDWASLQVIYARLHDAETALPLFTNAVEGSRSGKRKKKSALQQEMADATRDYCSAVDGLGGALRRKSFEAAATSLADAKAALGRYRSLAQIDGPDGGMVRRLPSTGLDWTRLDACDAPALPKTHNPIQPNNSSTGRGGGDQEHGRGARRRTGRAVRHPGV